MLFSLCAYKQISAATATVEGWSEKCFLFFRSIWTDVASTSIHFCCRRTTHAGSWCWVAAGINNSNKWQIYKQIELYTDTHTRTKIHIWMNKLYHVQKLGLQLSSIFLIEYSIEIFISWSNQIKQYVHFIITLPAAEISSPPGLARRQYCCC